jgi:hypothetical protein
MSDDPIKVVERANAWFAGVPFAELRGAVLEEATFDAGMARLDRRGHGTIEELIDPEIELDLAGFPGGETLPSGRGRDVWFSFWREWLEPWEDLAIEHSNYEARGDLVVVDIHVSGRGGISGVEVGLEMAQLWTVRDGRVTRYAVFGERANAIAAAEAEGAESR